MLVHQLRALDEPGQLSKYDAEVRVAPVGRRLGTARRPRRKPACTRPQVAATCGHMPHPVHDGGAVRCGQLQCCRHRPTEGGHPALRQLEQMHVRRPDEASWEGCAALVENQPVDQ